MCLHTFISHLLPSLFILRAYTFNHLHGCEDRNNSVSLFRDKFRTWIEKKQMVLATVLNKCMSIVYKRMTARNVVYSLISLFRQSCLNHCLSIESALRNPEKFDCLSLSSSSEYKKYIIENLCTNTFQAKINSFGAILDWILFSRGRKKTRARKIGITCRLSTEVITEAKFRFWV